jgi:small-conductance mechanosensitive channel
MDLTDPIINTIRRILDLSLFTLGETRLTIGLLFRLIILVWLLFFVTGRIKKWIVENLLGRSRIDIGVRQATASIVRYVLVTIGFIVILQTAGIDLSALTILAGALGIGVGFGLQNVTNNFVSGIIILFERPIKVGDRIEVGSVSGDVVHISARATTVITNDNIAIIVPNSEFISEKVTNWSYTDRDIRFNFPLSISHETDPDMIRRLLLEVVSVHNGVLKDPKPDVLLDEFCESSTKLILRIWTREYTNRPGVLRSELNYLISRKFREHGIKLPYPQRVVHVRTAEGIADQPLEAVVAERRRS